MIISSFISFLCTATLFLSFGLLNWYKYRMIVGQFALGFPCHQICDWMKPAIYVPISICLLSRSVDMFNIVGSLGLWCECPRIPGLFSRAIKFAIG